MMLQAVCRSCARPRIAHILISVASIMRVSQDQGRISNVRCLFLILSPCRTSQPSRQEVEDQKWKEEQNMAALLESSSPPEHKKVLRSSHDKHFFLPGTPIPSFIKKTDKSKQLPQLKTCSSSFSLSQPSSPLALLPLLSQSQSHGSRSQQPLTPHQHSPPRLLWFSKTSAVTVQNHTAATPTTKEYTLPVKSWVRCSELPHLRDSCTHSLEPCHESWHVFVIMTIQLT